MNSGPTSTDEFNTAVYRGDHKKLLFILYSVNEISSKTIKDALNYAVLAEAVDTVEIIFSLVALKEADVKDVLLNASFSFFQKMHGAIKDKIRSLSREFLKPLFDHFMTVYTENHPEESLVVRQRRVPWYFEQLLSVCNNSYQLPEEWVYPKEVAYVPTAEQMRLVNARGDLLARKVLLPQYRNSFYNYTPVSPPHGLQPHKPRRNKASSSSMSFN